jgi:hypothetical protein
MFFQPPKSPILGGLFGLGDTPRPPPEKILDFFFKDFLTFNFPCCLLLKFSNIFSIITVFKANVCNIFIHLLACFFQVLTFGYNR